MAGDPAPWLGDPARDRGPAPDACVWLKTEDGVRLRAGLWEAEGPARGHVLLLPGRTEYLEKYVRVIARLRERGFAVASLDWRGQGLADRKAGLLGHVDDFAEFQRDLRALLGWGRAAALPGPRVLLAHSMGGAIGLRALVEQTARPDAAVFSAPFWGLAGPRAQIAFARVAAWANALIGRGQAPLPGRPAEATYVLTDRFEGNSLTTDPDHWDWFVEQAQAHPELTLAAPTWGWLRAAGRELAALRAARVPDIPRLLLLGSAEEVVSAQAIRDHAARHPAAELVPIAGGRHETLMESPGNARGQAAWAAVDAFLDARAPR